MPAEVSQRIDGHRLWQRLMDLARFGATSKGGVCRLALSREDIEARAALVDWAKTHRSQAVNGRGRKPVPVTGRPRIRAAAVADRLAH